MAKYHLTAEKIKEEYDLTFNRLHPDIFVYRLILDCMRGCSQLRQRKVIESFFSECFKDVKTEFIDIDGIYGKYRKMVVIE